jgi:hypothetical protein
VQEVCNVLGPATNSFVFTWPASRQLLSVQEVPEVLPGFRAPRCSRPGAPPLSELLGKRRVVPLRRHSKNHLILGKLGAGLGQRRKLGSCRSGAPGVFGQGGVFWISRRDRPARGQSLERRRPPALPSERHAFGAGVLKRVQSPGSLWLASS